MNRLRETDYDFDSFYWEQSFLNNIPILLTTCWIFEIKYTLGIRRIEKAIHE